MLLIKKVAWPWRDVTPFESPRELESRALCVRADVCVGGVECSLHSSWSWVFF